jgi:polyisoprenoid-binding protein YceI
MFILLELFAHSSISDSWEEPMTTTTQPTTLAPAATWTVDSTHSQVGFSVDYMGGTFRGTFSPVEGSLQVDGDGNVSLTGSAPVSGVKVQDENLTGHLQSPDFFDAERYPELRFGSTDAEREGDRLTVRGELTIRGETKPVVLEGTIGEPADDPYGGVRFWLQLQTTVDRTEFGLNWNAPLPNGEPSLANDVTLTAELYLVKA